MATDLEAARSFARSFIPTEEPDSYAWVIDLAKRRFETATAAWKDIDEKAASIINFLASGTGLLSVGGIAVANSPSLNIWIFLSAIPAMACAYAALAFAVLARKASTCPNYPSLEESIRYVEGNGKSAQVQFLGQWELITEQQLAANNRKADWLNRAYFAGAVAAGALLLPAIVAICLRPAEPKELPPTRIEMVEPTKAQ